MERHASSAELKGRAKGQLLGKYGTLIPAVLVVEAIMFVISTMATFALNVNTLPGMILQFIIELLLQLLGGIFIAGQTYLYLNVSCGGNIRVSDVFYGFSHHPDRAILIQLLQMLYMLAFFIPFFVCLGIWAATESTLLILLMCLTFCIGLVGATIVSLQYSQSYFVLLDFPDFSALQCLKFSRKAMKGSMGRRFYLEISFLPIYLVGILTCGIGLLFVIPYVNATYANFYLELMEFRNRHSQQTA